jgi:hypothetical protein
LKAQALILPVLYAFMLGTSVSPIVKALLVFMSYT